MIIDNSDEKKAATPFDPNSSGLQSSSGYAGHSTSQYAGSQSYGAPPSYEDARFIQSPPSGFPPAPQLQFGANNQYQTQGYPSMSSNNPFDGTAPYAPIPNTNPFLHKVQAGYPPQAQQRPSPPSGGYPNDFARGPGPSAAEVNERGFPISPFEQQQQDLLRGKSTGSPYSASPRGSSNTPEPSSSSASSSMFDKVKSFSPGGPTPNQLLNPPPPSFMRAPPTNLPYAPFPPTALVSFSSKLENGFPLLPPPATTSPHPFTLHDINEDDWKRFLTDVKAAGALSITTKVVSHAAPLAMGIGFFPGMFIARGIENRKRSKKSGVVAELIDHWNHYFFHPRQLNITLAQGRMILSGPDDAYPPADVLYRKSHNTGHESYDDDSSDSSSDSGHEHSSNTGSGGGRGLGLSGRRAARRERLTEKRAVRSEKREKKRERKSVKNHNFRLVISYRPLTI